MAAVIFTNAALGQGLHRSDASYFESSEDSDISATLCPHSLRLSALLQSEAPTLAAHLMYSMLETCPQQALRPLAGSLYSLITCPALATSAHAWMGQAMSNLETDFTARGGSDRIGPQGRGRFLALSVARQPPLSRGRYEALVSDMAAWSRGEEGEGALLAYEM